MTALDDLEGRAAAGERFDRSAAERVLGCRDLVAIGVLGELARKARHGDRVTYVRVVSVPATGAAVEAGGGEVRIVGVPATAGAAVDTVRRISKDAGEAVLTGFTLQDLVRLSGGDHLVLADLAGELERAGLEAVASVALDRFDDVESVAEAARAVRQGGLRTARLTIEQASAEARLALIERAAALADALGEVQAFAPLPEQDPVEQPSTGYDDVKTVALARLLTDIPAIQVSWPLYGPKLAQVAIAYGASDLDAVPVAGHGSLGTRRAPQADVERQIRSAFAAPVERNGRFELRP